MGRSRVLNSEDFREKVKLSSRRSESMNFREVENRGISATEKRQRRRRLLKILNSRLRESSLSQCNATLSDRSPSSNIQSKFTKRQAAE